MNITDTAILIPTLNEKENLESLIPAIFELMPDVSVLISDDQSRDGTAELIHVLQRRFSTLFLLSRTGPFGYGSACVEGMRWAIVKGYRVIVTMDADYSHDYRIIPELIAESGRADVIVGSRYVTGGRVENWDFRRRWLSRFANLYVRVILGFPIRDVTTGFNAYRTATLDGVLKTEIVSNGYAFLVELKYRLLCAGATFFEHHIIFRERQNGASKMSRNVIWESIWMPWRLRFNGSQSGL